MDLFTQVNSVSMVEKEKVSQPYTVKTLFQASETRKFITHCNSTS